MIPRIGPMELARKLIGQHEKAGDQDNPLILWMLQRVAPWAEHDEIAWCAAYVSAICWLTGMPDTCSARARSWLSVGTPVSIDEADPTSGIYVVILSCGYNAPPADVLEAPGHVGFLVSKTDYSVKLFGGNQADSVSEADFPRIRILGVRCLTSPPTEEEEE